MAGVLGSFVVVVVGLGRDVLPLRADFPRRHTRGNVFGAFEAFRDAIPSRRSDGFVGREVEFYVARQLRARREISAGIEAGPSFSSGPLGEMAGGDNAHQRSAARFRASNREWGAANGSSLGEIDPCLFKGGPHRVGIVGDGGALAPLEIGYRGSRHPGFF